MRKVQVLPAGHQEASDLATSPNTHFPPETLIRHKELLLNGSMPRKQGSFRARNIGTIEEASELAKTLTEDMYVSEVEDCDNANESVFDQTKIEVEMLENEDRKQTQRTRQISTSLVRDPVKDDNLKDFHEHHLSTGRDPLDVRYKMYAMVCHSGQLGKGFFYNFIEVVSSQSKVQGP